MNHMRDAFRVELPNTEPENVYGLSKFRSSREVLQVFPWRSNTSLMFSNFFIMQKEMKLSGRVL